MKLSDIPPEMARDYLRGIIDRNKPPSEHVAWRVHINLDIDGRRKLWAADKYLEVLQTMGVGIEKRRVGLSEIREFLAGLLIDAAAQADVAEDVAVELSVAGLHMIKEAELHLDRFGIMRTVESRPSKNYGGKKR
ncbi:hypothetical protein MesoLjLc_51560 [Mesorhizobium sp. L-8-10]|uniref:hypothetical protein n=1 Tax=Mesorhizobium sp. L-8-10 TaxID=2744523 RepID=UPI001928D642|nr:hypothetical protein [Mesorhizobium sp. L-8-10]BCH33226.1 hypothetical protein MesoLjLc_51560 [Mesorhizobium sp. L-8-10]